MEQISGADRQRAGSFEHERQYRASGGIRSNKCKDLHFYRQTSQTGAVREIPKRGYSSWILKKETTTIQNGRFSISKTPSSNKSSSGNRKELSYQEYCYQPTPERRFSAEEAQMLIKTILENRLRDVDYGSDCSVLAKELADNVKKAAKGLFYERYKLICFVAIGQVKDCDISCSSRSIWCPVADTFAEYCFRNGTLFAVCVLYAVYQE